MHNPTRTLTLLLVFAFAGLSALGYMAYRYSKILEEPVGDGVVEVVRRVDQFIAVRRGMRREIDRHSADGGQLSLSVTRDRALAFHDLDPVSYGEVREGYRQWRAGSLPAEQALAAALERRRDELAPLDLGDYESLDR